MGALCFDYFGDVGVLQVTGLPEGTALARPSVGTMA